MGNIENQGHSGPKNDQGSLDLDHRRLPRESTQSGNEVEDLHVHIQSCP